MSWKNLARVVDHRFSLRTRVLYGTLGLLIAILLETGIGMGQQASTATAPIFNANAKYVQGVAPGYWPTTGAGLTLNLAAGSAYCGNPPALVTYPAGTLTMVNAATNLVYLDPAATCAPTVNQAANFAVGQIPIAKVVTAGSAITAITDMRGAGFAPLPCAMNSTGSVGCSALGANQNITLTPSGTGSVVVPGASGDGKIYLQTGPPNSSFLSFLQGNYMNISSNVLGCLNPNTSVLFSCSTIVGQVNTVGASFEAFNPTVVGNAASGTNIGLVAMQGDAYSEDAADVTQLIGTSGFAEQDGSGTITNMAAFYAQYGPKTAGTVINAYGFLASDQLAGTNNYTFYGQGGAPAHFSGGLDFLNKRCMADAQQPLSNNAGQKIAACIAALPATGGTVDARGFEGAQVISSAITFDRPVKLLLGNATFTYTGSALAGGLFVFPPASQGSSIVGTMEHSYFGQTNQVSMINVAPSTGPMPIFYVGTASTDNVMDITFDHITVVGSANVSDIVFFKSLAKGFTMKYTSFLGPGNYPSPLTFTSGYGLNFTSTTSGAGDSITLDHCTFAFLNWGFKDSLSNMSFKVSDSIFTFLNGGAWSITENGGAIFTNTSVANSNLGNIGITDALGTHTALTYYHNAAPLIMDGDQFEGNGTAPDILLDDGTTNFRITNTIFASGGAGSPSTAGIQIEGSNHQGQISNNTSSFVGGSTYFIDATGLTNTMAAPSNITYFGNRPGNTEFKSGNMAGFSYVENGSIVNRAGGGINFLLSQFVDGLSRMRVQNPSLNAAADQDLDIGTGVTAGVGDIILGVNQAASNKAFFDNRTGAPLQFSNNGTQSMLIDSSGNVRIGSGNPTARLDVDTSIKAGAQLISNQATGTAPIVVASTTPVANLSLGGGAGTSVKSNQIAGAINTVTSSATMNFDASLGNTQTTTLTLNVTAPTLSNCAAGEFLVFDIIQDATGSHTFVWPANVLNAGTIGSTAGKHNIQTFYCDGTNARATAAMLTNQN